MPSSYHDENTLHSVVLDMDFSSSSTNQDTSMTASAPPLKLFHNISYGPVEHDLTLDEEGEFVDEPLEDVDTEKDGDNDEIRKEPPTGKAKIKLLRWRGTIVVLMMILMAFLAALLAGIVMTVQNGRDDSYATTTPKPDMVSSPPSEAPDLSTDLNITDEQMDFMNDYGDNSQLLTDLAIEWSGQGAIDDTDSAARKALNWLLYYDPFHLVLQAKEIAPLDIQQRYVAAVLYFAMVESDDNESSSSSATTMLGSLRDNFLSDTDVCFWNSRGIQQSDADSEEDRGIVCNEKGIITQLQFQNLGVHGYLPKEIGHLSNVEILRFADNFLTGSVPPRFSDLIQLKQMDIRNCSLVGFLPSKLSEMHEHLESLLLSNNRISGPIPSSLGKLTNLRSFDLAFNDLTGEVPPELVSLRVESVYLNGNGFSGSLDAAFCTNVPKQELVADCLGEDVECSCCTMCCNDDGLQCKIVGLGPIGTTLAPEIMTDRLSKLQVLLEPISGPEALGDPESDQYKVLQWMAQSDPSPQDLDATDPIFIIQKYVLILIFVSTDGNGWRDKNGWLTEASVCSWDGISCNDEDLVDGINLANQNCRGSLASEIGALNHTLQSLSVKNNPFLSGELPSELGMLTRLTSLDVSACQFRGSLPPEVGKLYNLFEFSLDNNNLSGPVPSEVGGLNQLKFLSINSNDFTGGIPAEIGGMESLVTLAANDCNISSTIPPELGTLSNLFTLDLSRNALVGSIPKDFGELTQLESIHLNENSGINGTVPQGLAFVPNLKEIYLHGTAVAGNLDLLFCTGEIDQVTSNCLDPVVICTCCSICCDASGDKCQQP